MVRGKLNSEKSVKAETLVQRNPVTGSCFGYYQHFVIERSFERIRASCVQKRFPAGIVTTFEEIRHSQRVWNHFARFINCRVTGIKTGIPMVAQIHTGIEQSQSAGFIIEYIL